MIGYYVHHHGFGHVTRALAIATHLREEVVFFSSRPAPAALRPRDHWVHLPPDVPATGDRVDDETAGGRLHWAPLGVPSSTLRCARLLDELSTRPVRRVVVDVSVEAAVLVRLAGIPVTVMAMPGCRSDAAHQLGYDLADQIVAPWSAQLYEPAWLHGHSKKTHFVGAISRFDGRVRTHPASSGRGVLLTGAGGGDVPPDAMRELRRARPDVQWQEAGGASKWIDDLWPLLAGAEIIVTHAGQGALADVALAETAAVVVAQDRPFDEQHTHARALDRAGVAVVVDRWPVPDQWPALLDHALELGGRRWSLLSARGAAARAAAVLSA